MGKSEAHKVEHQVPFWELSFSQKLNLVKDIGSNSISNVTAYTASPLVNITNVYFLSRYAHDELIAGYGLALVYTLAFVMAMPLSLNQAGNVLMSQAFGAKDYKACGLYFQKSIILLCVILAPLMLTLLVSDNVMMYFGIEPAVAKYVLAYTRIMIPTLIGAAAFDVMKAYITSHKVFHPIIFIQLTTFGLHFLWIYVLVDWLQLGIEGAAICRFLQEWVNALLIFIYIKKSDKFKETWIPWSKEALESEALTTQLKFSIPVAAMSYICWFYYEVMTVVAGSFGTRQVVAHVAVANTSSLNYAITTGIAVTTMTYVANAVGKQGITEAKNYFYTGMSILVGFSITVITILLTFRNAWVGFWTTDEETQAYLVGIIIIYCSAGLMADNIINGCLGLLKAVGKQKIASMLVFVTYYPIGVPLMLLMTFYFDLQVKGLWIAFGIANVALAASGVYYAVKVNWTEVMEDSKDRLGIEMDVLNGDSEKGKSQKLLIMNFH